MASATTNEIDTLAAILERLGGIDPARVIAKPLPGKATEKDLLRLQRRTGKLYELVDGTLVEKVMGWLESSLAARIGRFLGNFVEEHDLGEMAGADGGSRLLEGLVRMPDVSFVSWNRLGGRNLPVDPIPDLVPDLAVEVLSESNTPGEMKRKRKEYFLAGVVLLWQVDPGKRTVEVFTAPDQSVVLSEQDTLDGGSVLPGLQLPVRAIFARVTQKVQEPAKRTRTRQPRRPGKKDV